MANKCKFRNALSKNLFLPKTLVDSKKKRGNMQGRLANLAKKTFSKEVCLLKLNVLLGYLWLGINIFGKDYVEIKTNNLGTKIKANNLRTKIKIENLKIRIIANNPKIKIAANDLKIKANNP